MPSQIPPYIPFVSPEGLKKLDSYSYTGIDNSILGKLFMNKFWGFLIRYVSTDIAPNTITMIGFLSSILCFFITLFFSPTLTEETPWYYKLAMIFLIFVYQTMDNIDGKQAKRTKSSSPLGELFDHSVDACVTGQVLFVIVACFRGGPMMFLIWMILCFSVFYFSHWEEYHTGALVFGKFNSPTEAQFLFLGLIVLTIFLPSSFWKTVLFSFDTFFFTPLVLVNTILSLMSFSTCFGYFKTVFRLNPRNGSMVKILSRAMPIYLFFLSAIIWIAPIFSYVQRNPYYYLIPLTQIFAYLQSRFLTQRICGEETRPIYFIQILHFIPCINSLLYHFYGITIVSHDTLAILFLFISSFQIIIFFWSIMWQLCKYLYIRPFTLVKQNVS